ncbi:MAG: biopolymer transporter ExbD [Spirochaetaceae bacterium]|jgi:biopolymer transport protein ExbD|nr:biopolymer transporter ExbD [Spirochaetaceae bacterium]
MKINRPRKKLIVPLNAMSDVAFLLLIFIMLVSLINYRKEVKIAYPEGETAKKVSVEKNLEIWVDRQGSVYLDGVPCGLGEVEIAVEELYRNAPETRIHLIADRNTPFVHINQVLKILQFLQYRVVSFVVKDA